MTVARPPALAAGLADIVGGTNLVSDAGLLARHAVDGVAPRWLARPGSVPEVSRVLALASAERLSVTPRGSGSSLGLGNRPARIDLVLDTTRLAAVTEYVPEDMVASVEAGLSLGALAAHLGGRGQRLALDPSGWRSRSVGGVLATNASGALRLRHGSARDLVLGVRFVQADGSVTWGGSRVVKSVSGYEVPRLLVGSLGTLGVIVGATVRLHPIPAATRAWSIAFGEPAAAEAFLAALHDSALEPDRLTLVNGPAQQMAGLGEGALTLLVSFGSVPEALESQGARLTRLATGRGGVAEIQESAWDALDPALSAPVAVRIACEPRRLIWWIGELERLARRSGSSAAVVAQAGNGILQAALAPGITPDALARDLVAPLRQGLFSEGGSLVVERAPDDVKATLDVWGPISPDTLTIMERLKREFDPDGILNPGRFVGGL